MNFSAKDFEEFINDTVPIGDVASHLGIIKQSYQGKYRSHNIFCPIHHNINTPHARLNVESNHIFCFVDHVQLYPYYLLKELGKLTHQQLYDHFGKKYQDHIQKRKIDPNADFDLSITKQSTERMKRNRVFIDSLYSVVAKLPVYSIYRKGEVPFSEFAEELDTVLLKGLKGHDLFD